VSSESEPDNDPCCGTSYAFKAYLSQIDHNLWAGFTETGSWPGTVYEEDELSTGGGVFERNFNDLFLVQNTAANPGSVGYADTGDAAQYFTEKAASSTFGTLNGQGNSPAHQILWAQIQNNGTATTGETYANTVELVAGKHRGKCESTKLIPSDKGFPYSYTDSWSGIVTSDPNISHDAESPEAYPICALTYDVVWHHYSAVNLYGKTETAQNIANTVRSLFEYITGNEGQEAVEYDYYDRYPEGMDGHVKQAVDPGIGY
jgi:hypothetical protein